MATGQMSEQAARAFADKLENFGKSLNDEERHFLAVILAAAASVGNDVQGYSDVDATGLQIGDTAAQVFYQYVEVRDKN